MTVNIEKQIKDHCIKHFFSDMSSLQEILHKLQLDLKAEGNELFVEKEITKACLCYNEALSIMNLVTMEKMFEDVALEEIVLCNRAECLLRIGEEDGVEQALIDCENILNNMNPKNEKAMFRKVKALKKLGRVDEAWRAIQQLKLIRNDSKVIQLENEIRAIIDEQTLQYLEHRTRALVEAPMPENPEENAEVYDHDDIELMKNLYMMMRLGLLPPHPPAVSPIPPAAQDPMHHGKRTGSPNARGSESGSAKTSSGGVPLRNSGPGLGEPRYRFYSDISDSARGDSGFAEATLGPGDYEEEENKTWLASGTNGPDTQETETKGKKKKAKKKKKKKKKSKAASDFDDRDPNDQSMVSGPRDESEKGEVVIERDSTADGNYDSDTTTATLQVTSSASSQQHIIGAECEKRFHTPVQLSEPDELRLKKPAAEALNPPVPPNITVPPTVDLREMLETHDFALVCQQCYTQTPGQFGQESYKLNSNLEHTCWADTLLCTRKASRVFCWKKIRPRTNKKYQGKYWLCNEFEHEEKCGVREDLCYFCHSEEEIEFWTLERKQKVDRQSLMAYLKKLPGYRTRQSVGGDGVKNVSQMPSHPTVQPQMLLHDTSRRAPSPKPVTGPELTTPRPATPHLQIHATTMHRSQSPVPSHNKPPATPEQLKRLLEECGGQFVMCCKDCFMKSSRICIKSMGDLSQFCSANDKHPWKSNEMMMHVRQEGHDLTFFRIAQVPAQVATRTRFALCIHSYHRTIPQFRERCTFPHSAAEKSVWEFEAVTSTTRNQIVAASTYHASQPVITRKITITDKELKPKAQELMAPQLPFKLQVVCKACWTRTRQPVEEHRQQSGKCARGSHEWKGDNQEIIIFSERTKRWVPVNSIPRFIVERNQTLFQICKHSQRGKDHYRELMGRDCANPHSQEEMELWKWQLKNKGTISFMRITCDTIDIPQ
ncbi:zinc finger CCCH domain-containing protein 7B-like [Ptychodera flava]|uniref:zinc finger CCCH domain-containing protein 7B-like n=1 Tax=Ptychodera flava TaxID=63121 RepID=UPI00396A48FF